MSWFELIVPFVVSLYLYLREYGSTAIEDFSGWGAFKMIPVVLFIAHVSALSLFGESLFCGYCYSKSTTNAFLLPSLGYAMAAFPSLFGGSVFDTGAERIAEFMTALMGWLLVFTGLIMILAFGRLS
jgi:hypothetical protein